MSAYSTTAAYLCSHIQGLTTGIIAWGLGKIKTKPAGGQKTTAGGNGQPGFFNKQKEKPFALFLRKEGRADNAGVIAELRRTDNRLFVVVLGIAFLLYQRAQGGEQRLALAADAAADT